MNATEILASAIDEHNPSHVFALFSGGDDSVCAAHIASKHPRFTACALIDTGIALAEAHAHAHAVCKAQGWPLIVVRTPVSYDDWVRANGFPGPFMHNRMYTRLKERAVRILVSNHKQHPKDRIGLVTGMRRKESKRRMLLKPAPIQRNRNEVWIAPMFEWSTTERDTYQDAHKLPHNPIKNKLHISGDCLCGAFADKGDLEILQMFYPTEAKRITDLQAEVQAKFPWSWDEAPPDWLAQVNAGQQFLGDDFMPLCWSCERNGP